MARIPWRDKSLRSRNAPLVAALAICQAFFPANSTAQDVKPSDICLELPLPARDECAKAAKLLEYAPPPERHDLTVRISVADGRPSYRYTFAGDPERECSSTTGTLVLPTAASLMIVTTSWDDIYSWHIPVLDMTFELIPGRINETRIKSLPSVVGTFEGRLTRDGDADGVATKIRFIDGSRDNIDVQAICSG